MRLQDTLGAPCDPSTMMRVLLTLVAGSSALQPACVGHCHAKSGARYARAPTSAITMDETILEKALRGELEEEGAENIFMSEVGWASYLDKEGEQSYNMNERVSKAKDGYFTPDLFSNPIDVATSWFQSMVRVAEDPLAGVPPSIFKPLELPVLRLRCVYASPASALPTIAVALLPTRSFVLDHLQ